MTNEQPIPESVLNALEDVRESGMTNMFARETVIFYVDALGEDEADQFEAVTWLNDNDDRYMEALNEMGARRGATA